MLKNNIDNGFDYSTIKAIVLKSFENIVKEEALKNKSNVPDDVISDFDDNVNNLLAPPTPSLLKLKIRNTTQ
jgi:hypothetical protein